MAAALRFPLFAIAFFGWLWAEPAVAGPYARLKVLLPGENAAPGTPSGKTGTPTGQFTLFAHDDTDGTVARILAYLTAPQRGWASDPFIVHPASFGAVQIIAPGEEPLPGSLSGRTGTTAQTAGRSGEHHERHSGDPGRSPSLRGPSDRLAAGGGPARHVERPARDLVSSGGYVTLIEAQGTGETLHIIRRRIGAVR